MTARAAASFAAVHHWRRSPPEAARTTPVPRTAKLIAPVPRPLNIPATAHAASAVPGSGEARTQMHRMRTNAM